MKNTYDSAKDKFQGDAGDIFFEVSVDDRALRNELRSADSGDEDSIDLMTNMGISSDDYSDALRGDYKVEEHLQEFLKELEKKAKLKIETHGLNNSSAEVGFTAKNYKDVQKAETFFKAKSRYEWPLLKIENGEIADGNLATWLKQNDPKKKRAALLEKMWGPIETI